MEPLAYDGFQELLRASKRAFHVEFRDTYNVRGEDGPFERFRRGEPDDFEWLAGWLEFIREVTAAGVVVQRARIVSVPHGDYTRWGFAVAPHSIAAGEDIRYLPRRLARGIDFPAEDYWLFDDDTLVWSVFSDGGRTGGFAREFDADPIAGCRTVRDEIWARAVPFAEYV